MSSKSNSKKGSNRVRIIGGKFRGRMIEFISHETLRPTPDRVRETLFNWLQPYIIGAHCLDLYTGSGVLAIESKSRGATQVLAVDKNSQTIKMLQKQIERLGLCDIDLKRQDVLNYLDAANSASLNKYDIVFIDPPYQDKVFDKIFARLESNEWLKPKAKIYFEANYQVSEEVLPSSWSMLKSKKAGQINYYLAESEGVKSTL